MLKKLITISTLIGSLGIASFLTTSAFADTTNASLPTQQYNQAVVSWNLVSGAKCYNIYYGWVQRKIAPSWKHSVRCVPNNMWQYTIKGLKQDRTYQYTVAALSYSGKEFSWTPVTTMIATPQQ